MNNLNKNVTVIDKASYGGATFEVLAYDELNGAQSISTAMGLFYINQSGLKLKQIRITLNNDSIKTEAGALYYYKGRIETKSNIGGVGGLFKKAVSGTMTNESTVKPSYSGTGEIILEPSYKHYILMELNNESIIIDKGMFYCCSDSINIKAFMQRNVSSAMLGGEGIFQLELSGSGIVVLESNVPQSEIIECEIAPGEELKVDGNFAIARTSGVTFSVTTSEKSLIGSALNGEGLLNTFRGQGTVWIAPTQPVYARMAYGALPTSNSSMNNRV